MANGIKVTSLFTSLTPSVYVTPWPKPCFAQGGEQGSLSCGQSVLGLQDCLPWYYLAVEGAVSVETRDSMSWC